MAMMCLLGRIPHHQINCLDRYGVAVTSERACLADALKPKAGSEYASSRPQRLHC